jgi:hypothetical protein
LDSFFSFWLVFNRLHFSWFFIVLMIPVYPFLSSWPNLYLITQYNIYRWNCQ